MTTAVRRFVNLRVRNKLLYERFVLDGRSFEALGHEHGLSPSGVHRHVRRVFYRRLDDLQRAGDLQGMADLRALWQRRIDAQVGR